LSQNIWAQRAGLHRQKRRAQLIQSYLKKYAGKRIMDVGCAEGYATSFISAIGAAVIGVEINIEYIKVARSKLRNVEFVNASITSLPFRSGLFDAVCVLEVLEHLNMETQRRGLEEIDKILVCKGTLIISVPFNEAIIQTSCIHCGKTTPLFGHLRSLDESDITKLLPRNRYKLTRTYRLPNLQIISCKGIFESMPLRVWLILNDALGIIRKGYWIVLHYNKEG
jgi:ubiquinone/menaquinone biosynthesis C-methylase UbiE